jgi:hypothetical protein
LMGNTYAEAMAAACQKAWDERWGMDIFEPRPGGLWWALKMGVWSDGSWRDWCSQPSVVR